MTTIPVRSIGASDGRACGVPNQIVVDPEIDEPGFNRSQLMRQVNANPIRSH